MPERLPSPGPSFLREQPLKGALGSLRAGMSRPADGPEDWWLVILWVADDDGVVSFAAVAPSAGPPPE
ncbi:MAG: hypothetical protein M3R32_05865, partial [Chloroflexota bacterium]|nr:hypothetical protein [Chloroflexota bacterium]